MPKSLSEGWEVEWCYHLEGDPYNGVDPDSAKYQYQDFRTKEQALAFAKKVLPKDKWGSVRVSNFHSEFYEPDCPATFREYYGDSILVEA